MLRGVVTKEYLYQWLKKLESAWVQKDFELVEVLFAKCTEYIEAPFVEPGHNIDDIKYFWAEVMNHSHVQLSYDVIVLFENKAVVNYSAKYFDGNRFQQSNGIYIIDYDEEGCCTAFRQWSVMLP